MSTHSTTPPLDPILIPDSPTDQKQKSEKAVTVVPPVATISKSATKKPRHSRTPKPGLTLETAFTCEQSGSTDTVDLEKAIRSISFLLQWSSDIGNDDPDGPLVNGLTFALDKIAAEVHRLYTHDDILKLGGDPRTIKKQELVYRDGVAKLEMRDKADEGLR
jgi:hypothetical protein